MLSSEDRLDSVVPSVRYVCSCTLDEGVDTDRAVCACRAEETPRFSRDEDAEPPAMACVKVRERSVSLGPPEVFGDGVGTGTGIVSGSDAPDMSYPWTAAPSRDADPALELVARDAAVPADDAAAWRAESATGMYCAAYRDT